MCRPVARSSARKMVPFAPAGERMNTILFGSSLCPVGTSSTACLPMVLRMMDAMLNSRSATTSDLDSTGADAAAAAAALLDGPVDGARRNLVSYWIDWPTSSRAAW